MELDEFIKKLGWTNNEEAISREIGAVEKIEGRPVYFGEVLLLLYTKANATERLSQPAVNRLNDFLNSTKDRELIGTVFFADVVKKGREITGTATNKTILYAKIKESLKNKAAQLRKLGHKPEHLFSEQAPLYYICTKEAIASTVFEDMEDGKSETNVARQFANWLAQKSKDKPSYLTLKYHPTPWMKK